VRQIEFWLTVREAYRFVFSDLTRFVQTAGVWIVGTVVLNLLVVAQFGDAALVTHAAGGHIPKSFDLVAFGFLIGLFNYAGSIAFAVAWHRAVLLEETPGFIGALRFGRREWRFLFYSWGIGLVVAGIAVAVVLILLFLGRIILQGQSIEDLPLLIKAASLAWVVVIVLILGIPLVRLTLGLPAIAVDEPSGVWGRAWRRGAGNGLRLVGGAFLCVGPITLVAVFANLVQGFMVILAHRDGGAAIIGSAGEIVFLIVMYLARYLGIAAGVSFLSLSYRQLTEE
jgi:hypothetical protein